MYAAVRALDPLRADLAAELTNAANPDEARRVIDGLGAKVTASQEFARSMFETALKGQMAGRLFVEDIELPRGLRKMAAGAEEPFLRLTLEEAIARFRDRRIVTPEEFDAMERALRERSFMARNLAADEIVTRAKALLDQAISEGLSLREFAKAINEDEAALGFTESNHAYLENVYRTNVAQVYNDGRWEQMSQPHAMAVFGWAEYRTAGDNRVRLEHEQLHGRAWRMDDPQLERVRPPNGFCCRCVLVPAMDSDLTDEQKTRQVNIESVRPPGWA